MGKHIGKVGTLTTARERLAVKVRVVDVRRSYGRVDFLVEPLDGSGRAWVTAKRVRFGKQ